MHLVSRWISSRPALVCACIAGCVFKAQQEMSTSDLVTPDAVLKFTRPTDGFLCPLSANEYGIEFQKFEIRDYDSGQTVYSSMTDMPSDDLAGQQLSMEAYEELVRSIQYTFPSNFLDFSTIRTMLEFKVGDQPLNNFRMIELHYFKDKLVRTYDFNFGFCIPNSVNTWEAIYDVPKYTKEQKHDYVAQPFSHKSDSFYFVDEKLVMHNKASYAYV